MTAADGAAAAARSVAVRAGSALGDVGTGARADRALGRTIRNRVLTPVTVVLLAVAAACAGVELAGGIVPPAVQVVPFAVSVLVFGLPHGALDHLVPARLTGMPVLRSVVEVTVVYLVVGGATALLWLWQPLAGFALFVLLTWFHWGQGDLWVDRLLGDGTRSRGRAVATVAARGALPMVVPLVAAPAAYAAVVVGTTGLTGAGADAVERVLAAGPTRAVAAVVVLVLVAIDLMPWWGSDGARRGAGRRPDPGPGRGRGRRVRPRPAGRPLLEVVVLLVFFAVVPPVLAVGLYFTLWHSVRHVLRLELTDPASAERLRQGRLGAPFLRFLRQAWPITAIAVAMLVGLSLVLRRADLGVYLALIAALTTPHAVVVTWMDRRQRTWR